MKILVFEWLLAIELNGDGLSRLGDHPENQSMLQQAGGMLMALTQDLQQAGHQVVVAHAASSLTLNAPWSRALADLPQSSRFELPVDSDWRAALGKLLPHFDAIWGIAPESDGCLLQLNQFLAGFPVRKLHPQGELVALATSKTATLDFLDKHGLQPTFGRKLDAQASGTGMSFEQPMVLKCDDGAGSEFLQFVTVGKPVKIPTLGVWRLEPWLSGLPISVSVLSGSEQIVTLEPTVQCFDARPAGNYTGGDFPIEPSMRDRALALVQQAMRVLPTCRGYLGFDLMMNCPELNGESLILEINPRLTCSYLGLRKIYRSNLAAATVDLHEGVIGELIFDSRRRRFDLTF